MAVAHLPSQEAEVAIRLMAYHPQLAAEEEEGCPQVTGGEGAAKEEAYYHSDPFLTSFDRDCLPSEVS